MSDGTVKPGALFWVIGVVALFWNLVGFAAYLGSATATPESLAETYTAEQVELMLAVPAWATSATALATTFGVLGSLFLLLRRGWALPAFVISLAALIVQDAYLFGVIDSVGMFGKFPLYFQSAVLLIAALLIWFAQHSKGRGWLR